MQQDHIGPPAVAPLAVIGRGHHFSDNAGIRRKRRTRHWIDFRRTPLADKAICVSAHKKEFNKSLVPCSGARECRLEHANVGERTLKKDSARI
jgi:hypothetical protein